MNKLLNKLWVAAGVTLLLLVSACGGGTGLAPVADTATGVVEGYITAADLDRAVFAAGDGIAGVEVWCEELQTRQRLGQDTTDETGHYRIEGLAEDQQLVLRFCYRHATRQDGQNRGGQIDVEGEQQITLRTREQLRLNIRICEYDSDGDGVPDGVDCDNEQVQVRLRRHDHGETEA